MTNIANIEIFKNEEFGSVRVVVIDNDPWFVGRDVAAALGYANTKDALGKHVEAEDKQIIQRSQNATFEIPVRGLTIINESGLYSLMLMSKLPSAKRFKHWITSEVLPSLRANGIYITDPLVKQIAEDPDYLYALWDTLKRQNERLQSQDEIISAQSEELDLNDCLIDDLSWKANYYDDFIDESDGVTVRVAAKQIGTQERALVSLLIGCHYLYRCDGRLLPYADKRCAGLFVVREHRTLITPKGKARILELLDFLASEPEAAS